MATATKSATSSRGKKAAKLSSTAAAPAGSSSPSTSATKLLDSHVSSAQALKAFKALQAHRKKHKTAAADKTKETGKSQLPLDAEDDDDDNNLAVGAARTEDTIYLNVTVKRLDANKKAKPIMVPLPHPIHDPSTSTVCLFVKDPQRHYKDLLPTLGVKSVHRIIGVSKLKGKFAPFEARRQLLDEYDIFLCDERVGPLMPKLLGSKWQQKKKMPISVNVVRTKHLKQELDKAVGSSRFFANRGSTMSLPIGSASRMTADDLVENLAAALPVVMKRVPYEGWKNVQNVEVKTGKSASLPIWSSDLKDRWTGIETEGDESDEEEEQGAEIPTPKPVEIKVKKSSAVDVTEPPAQKKKRSGAAAGSEEVSWPKKRQSSKA